MESFRARASYVPACLMGKRIALPIRPKPCAQHIRDSLTLARVAIVCRRAISTVFDFAEVPGNPAENPKRSLWLKLRESLWLIVNVNAPDFRADPAGFRSQIRGAGSRKAKFYGFTPTGGDF